jgi:hypothetical protein
MPPGGTSLPKVLFLDVDFVAVGLTVPVIFAVVLSSLSVGFSDSDAEAVFLAVLPSVVAAAPLDALDAAVERGASVVGGEDVSGPQSADMPPNAFGPEHEAYPHHLDAHTAKHGRSGRPLPLPMLPARRPKAWRGRGQPQRSGLAAW